jgi:hypothetical protein
MNIDALVAVLDRVGAMSELRRPNSRSSVKCLALNLVNGWTFTEVPVVLPCVIDFTFVSKKCGESIRLRHAISVLTIYEACIRHAPTRNQFFESPSVPHAALQIQC